MWEMNEALERVRELETHLSQHGYHCAIGGGVVFKGCSTHDLDIVVPPHSTEGHDLTRLWGALIAFGWRRYRTAAKMQAHWRTKGSDDCKHVEVWINKWGRRIDVIVWPGGSL